MNREIMENVHTFVKTYPKTHAVETAWRTPVVGFADANDPKFAELKQIIGPNHALPQDIVLHAKSVVVYFVPFGADIVKSNIPGEESSRAWDIANIETNQLITELNRTLHDWITERGFQASLLPPTYNYDSVRLVSDWSHKSAAYIAGIGKFGINQVLITEQGCCGRIGSVITDMKLEPGEFQDAEYCLYKRSGKCGVCIMRCPNDALDLAPHAANYDRYRCNEQIYDKIVPQYAIGTGDACGKCMCGVPCAVRIP